MADTMNYVIKEIKSNQETIAKPFLERKNGQVPSISDVSGLFVPPSIQEESKVYFHSFAPIITEITKTLQPQTSSPPVYKPPLLPSPYDQNPQIVNGNFVPEKASLIKQVSCPTIADVKYNNSSISFITEKLIPESLGYIIGYGFTGMGQNDSSSYTDKMGITGSYGNRVLGYNYFLDSGTCSSLNSSSECSGQSNSFYIRGAPTIEPKGMLTGGLVQDVVDLNPVQMVEALYGTGNLSTSCTKRSLPIGSSIDNAAKQHGSRLDYLRSAETCLDGCNRIRQNTSTAKSNCIKKCSEGWWLENKCTSNMDKFKYGRKEYFDSIESNSSKESSKIDTHLMTSIYIMILLGMCIIIWNII